MLRRAFAAGAIEAFAKFSVAGQPTLSSVGMAPPVVRGLPPAAKPLTPQSLGLGNPNSAGMPLTPTQLLPALTLSKPAAMPKVAEEAQRPSLCTSCRKAKHYGPCVRECGTPNDGIPLRDDPASFIRMKLRGP